MFLDEATSKLLIAYLIETLSQITTVDPELLAKYVLTLINKHDKSLAEIRPSCEELLDTFLFAETKPFVSNLFNVLQHQENDPERFPAYLQGLLRDRGVLGGSTEGESRKRQRSSRSNSPERKRRREADPEREPEQQPRGQPIQVMSDRDQPRGQFDRYDRDPRDNRYPDRDYRNGGRDRDGGNRDRDWNRDGGNRDGGNRDGGRDGWDRDSRHPQRDLRDPRYRNEGRGREPNRRGDFDRRGRDRDNFGGPQNQGFDRPPQPRTNPAIRSRPRCHDYFQRGWCEKGDACPFDHGQDAMVMDYDELEQLNKDGRNGNVKTEEDDEVRVDLVQRQNKRNRSDEGHDSLVKSEEYNPQDNGSVKDEQDPREHNGRKGWRKDGERPDRGDRPDRERSKNLSHDPNATIISVVNIPPNLNNIGKIDEHFRKFGHIERIEILHSHKKASVKFTSHNDALKAMKSPEAVFGNRFIKVFWATDSDVAQIKEGAQKKEEEQAKKEQKKKQVIEAKQQQVKEAQTQQQLRTEIIQKKMDLVKQKRATRDLLLEQIKKPGLATTTKADYLKKITELSESIKADLESLEQATPSVPTKKLKPNPPAATTPTPAVDTEPQTAAVEEGQNEKKVSDALEQLYLEKVKEASTLGIDPFAKPRRGGGADRGGGRGFPPRGRGADRGGRGGFTPRGRGAGRGRLTLDNRTTSFRLTGMPEGNLDEAILKDHFKQFGTVLAVTISGSDAIVKMDSRHAAEAAFYKGTTINANQAVPHWYNEPAPPQDTGEHTPEEDIIEEQEIFGHPGGGQQEEEEWTQ